MSAKPPDLEPPNSANPGADFTFRPMVPADLSLLHDWIQRPHWCEWWGPASTLADVAAEYGPLMADRTRVQPYIVLRGGAPFGYVQSYVALNSGGGWWEDETDPGVRGIDQSIADADQLGRGLGTAMVKAFVTTLFADPQVSRVQTDPNPRNARAIRCYEKAGFRAVGEVQTPDGAALLMICERVQP